MDRLRLWTDAVEADRIDEARVAALGLSSPGALFDVPEPTFAPRAQVYADALKMGA